MNRLPYRHLGDSGILPPAGGRIGIPRQLTLTKHAAAVLRAGLGIRLDPYDGKVFVVTIDDPRQPGSSALRQRRAIQITAEATGRESSEWTREPPPTGSRIST